MSTRASKSKFVPKHIIESDFAKDYQNGMSKQEIARKYCIAITTVYRYASNLDIRRNSALKQISNRKVSELDKDEIYRMYTLTKTSVVSLAKKLNVDKDELKKFIDENGLHRSKGKLAPKLTAEEMKMGYRICKECGKKFYIEYSEYWGWKINDGSRIKIVCSYHCMRAIEKRKRKTRLDIYGENAEYTI